MKVAVLITAFAGFIFPGCDDNIIESNLPSVVVNAVKAKYTTTDRMEWEKSAAGYEAEFHIGKTETKVLVDSLGNIQMEKQELKPDELPSEVFRAITVAYKEYTIKEVDKLEKEGLINYQVELKENDSGKNIELVYTTEGKTGSLNYWN